jgi:hypothetical protein
VCLSYRSSTWDTCQIVFKQKTPFKKTDHTNKVANPEKLAKTEVGEAAKQGEDLAAPITFTPYKVCYFLSL